MTILRNIAIGLFGIVALLLLGGLALPNTAHLERSVVIDARPATVFTVLNSYKLFNQWSPWAELDPSTIYTDAGPASGVGARQSWNSENPDVGSGSQEIVTSEPYSYIKQSLVFGGFDTDNSATFTLTPAGEGTQVVWSYDTSFRGSLLMRYFGLFLEKMIGPDYERGLARLKPFVEGLPDTDFSTLKVEVVDTKPLNIAYVSAVTANSTEAIGAALAEAYGKQLSVFLKDNQLAQTEPPLAIYDACDADDGNCTFRAGIAVDRSDVTVADDSPVKLGQALGGKALKVVHIGPYKDLRNTENMLAAYMAASGLVAAGPLVEQYVSDPAATAEAELVTQVYQPLK